MGGIDPLNLRRKKQLLGSNLLEWILLIISIIGSIFISEAFLLLSLLWVENFFFWLIPIITFQFYHWEAYRNKMILKEYLEIIKLKKLTKQMEKE